MSDELCHFRLPRATLSWKNGPILSANHSFEQRISPLETEHTPQRQRAKLDGVQFINLSQHWFASLSHLRSVTDNWREDYNHRRPHADPIDDCCALLDESLANAMHAQL